MDPGTTIEGDPGQKKPSRLGALRDFVAVAETRKDAVTVFKDLATVVALALGALWSYWLVIQYRDTQPKASLDHHVTIRPLPSHKALLTVDVDMTNTGKVIIKPLTGRVNIYRVLPLNDDEVRLLESGNLIPRGKPFRVWPDIPPSPFRIEGPERRLEPGESEKAHYEVVIDESIRTIQVYSFFNHPTLSKPEQPIGWELLTTHDLSSGLSPSIPQVLGQNAAPVPQH
jgi:hypothetical protein